MSSDCERFFEIFSATSPVSTEAPASVTPHREAGASRHTGTYTKWRSRPELAEGSRGSDNYRASTNGTASTRPFIRTRHSYIPRGADAP